MVVFCMFDRGTLFLESCLIVYCTNYVYSGVLLLLARQKQMALNSDRIGTFLADLFSR